MKTEPTYLGSVSAVSGSDVNIYLAKSVSSGLAIINGTTYRIGQVGSFVRIPQGYTNLYGIVCDIGADAVPEKLVDTPQESGSWIKAQLVGESMGNDFERGISQYPSVNDDVHLVTEKDLAKIYGTEGDGHIEIGRLASAENIKVKLDLDKLVTRHSTVLGSTGSGKSTTVASLLRSISDSNYPSARVLLLDIHGEYSAALKDVASVFRIEPQQEENKLSIPYWALDTKDLMDFLFGGMDDHAIHIYDKITELKSNSLDKHKFEGVDKNSLTVDTPIPYSLKRLWYELIDEELKTFKDLAWTDPAFIQDGDAVKLIEPKYEPHGAGSKPPFMNTAAPGIKRQLRNLRSRLLDRQYDFLLHPDVWEPDLDGKVKKDLPELLKQWLGHDKPITILDLSGVPSTVLVQLIGAILKIIYTALFWSKEKSEGGLNRPLLIVMEEAHRYLNNKENNASKMVQQIVKEGRKYGVGAMVVSQRPSEVDETILSQCGTFFGLRLSNPADRAKVTGTLPDSLAGLMDMLPVLRTGEAIITGEAATLPIRCRITLPDKRPDSSDPEVTEQWKIDKQPQDRMDDIYNRITASWRSQLPTRPENSDLNIERTPVKEGEE